MTHPVEASSLVELRAKAEAASPGNWRRAKGTPNYRIYGNFREVASAFQVRHSNKAGDLLVEADGHANADYIVAVQPSTVLALLDHIEQLERQLAGVPKFEGVPKRKLDDLLARGWEISGYAIHKDGEHGLVTDGGFVGRFTTAEKNAQAAERQLATARTALGEIATALQSSIDAHEFNSRHMIAEDSLQDAWKMLDMARDQFQVDANSLRIPLARIRSLQSEGQE